MMAAVMKAKKNESGRERERETAATPLPLLSMTHTI
jgi:hypothetical protein